METGGAIVRSLVLAVLVATAACAPARGRPAVPTPPTRPFRIAVLPPLWANPSPILEVDAASAMVSGLRSVEGVEVVAVGGRAGEVAAEGDTCAETPECLRRLGRDLEVDRALEVRLAGLGDTVLVRVTVVDVSEGTREQTRQSVVRSATPSSVAEAVGRMGAEIARAHLPAERQEPTPWHRRWWVWVAASAVVAGGAGLAVGLAVGPEDDPRPDVVITPP